MAHLQAEKFKFLVAILYTNTAEEVATVSENWRVDDDVICYPNFKGPKMEKALRSHQSPDEKWLRFPYSVLKICDDWKMARAWENRALDPDSELLTSDTEEPKKRKSLPPERFSPSASAENRPINTGHGPSTSSQKSDSSKSADDSDSTSNEDFEQTLFEGPKIESSTLHQDQNEGNQSKAVAGTSLSNRSNVNALKAGASKVGPAKAVASTTVAAKTVAAKTGAAKTSAATTGAAKTNAATTGASKTGAAKGGAGKVDIVKTVLARFYNPQKDGTRNNSRCKAPTGITPLSPLRNFNHQLPVINLSPIPTTSFDQQSVVASPGSKRRLAVDCSTSSSFKKPMTAPEPSMEKNVSRLMLKKSFEILETVGRVEQKLDRLLAVQDNQHIEDLFDEIMKLPVDDRDSWLMLEDLLVENRSGIKLVSKLSTIGGTDMGDFVRRIWAALVTDNFGCELSWIAKNKQKIKVQGSNTFSVVVKAVKANSRYANVDDAVIEDVSKDWIYKSKRRLQRLNEAAAAMASMSGDGSEAGSGEVEVAGSD